jgi:hypothetical protein
LTSPLVAAHQRVDHCGEFRALDRLDELVVRVDHGPETDRLSRQGVHPTAPGELLGAAGVGAGRAQQVPERLVVCGLPGRLELEVEVLEEVRACNRRQLHLGGLAEYRLIGALEHHL